MKSVLQQVPGSFLPVPGLPPGTRSYNAGMIRHGDRRIIAYRHEPKAGGNHGQLRIAELVDGKLVKDQPIHLQDTGEREGREDPRLFSHDGRLWIAWTSARYSVEMGEWTCRQLYGELVEKGGKWSVPAVLVPDYGTNTGKAREKNWQFFSVGGELFAQYQPHKVLRISGDQVTGEWSVDPIRWPWGKASGGTPPIPYGDGLLITFFHAFDFDETHARRYNFAALVFEDRPPFRHVAASVVPVVIASEADPLPTGEVWQPLCIFPCGAVADGDGWTVSAGVNDERIVLLHLTAEHLFLQSNNPPPLPPMVDVRIIAPVVLGGEIVMPPASATLPRRTAIELRDRRKIAILPQ